MHCAAAMLDNRIDVGAGAVAFVAVEAVVGVSAGEGEHFTVAGDLGEDTGGSYFGNFGVGFDQYREIGDAKSGVAVVEILHPVTEIILDRPQTPPQAFRYPQIIHFFAGETDDVIA